MKRRILVFTGTRAEYGLLRSVVRLWAAMPEVETHLLVSGAHLAEAYGSTVSEIHLEDVAIHHAPIDLRRNDPAGICRSMGQAMELYGAALCDLRPDIVVVLGDRYETFCMAAAAAVSAVPLAHLYGGELTEGAVDEFFRHAITKMAHLHFTACESYRRRVIQMGENPERVWNVGSLGVENVHTLTPLPEEALRRILGLPPQAPYLVVTFHPPTLEPGTEQTQLMALLEALAGLPPEMHVVFTGANADAGGAVMNIILRQRVEAEPRWRFFLSLGVERYVSALRYAAGVVGNSSSGLIEAPSLGLPVLDIGDRQKGRERSPAVLHCAAEGAAIQKGLAHLLEPETLQHARTCSSPYDKPGTACRIVENIAQYPLTALARKKFYDAV